MTGRHTTAATRGAGVTVDAGTAPGHHEEGLARGAVRFVAIVATVAQAADVIGVTVSASEPAVILDRACGTAVRVGVVAVTVETKLRARHDGTAARRTRHRGFLENILVG